MSDQTTTVPGPRAELSEAGTPLLALRSVEVAYGGIVALKGVDLEVRQGEIVALLGANGAGKTTTLRTISGLLSPRSGEVLYAGETLAGVPAHKIVQLGIGHSPEGRRIFSRMTVLENLEMGAYRFKSVPRKDLDQVFDLFPRLHERRTQLGGNLSGGEQQMLAIGRAMMGRPSLLLLDEPSMGLAPLIVAQIFEIIERINELGTTILLVEQNAAQALKLAHRGYVLETGQVVMSAPAGELLNDPRVREAYLGEAAEG
ncbi:MAG: ABC transporter ATP-binding protein [Catenulispora sp.]|nr:ABC transporter ATP-binding protein [Catenulispora sp.]